MSALLFGKAQGCFTMGAFFVNVGLAIPELSFFAFEEGNYLSSESKVFCVFRPSFIYVSGKHTEHCIAQQSVINKGKGGGRPEIAYEYGNHRHGKGRPHAYAEKVIRTVSAQHKCIKLLT